MRAQHEELLSICHRAFLHSEACSVLLVSMGQYDDHVQALVNAEDLEVLVERLMTPCPSYSRCLYSISTVSGG